MPKDFEDRLRATLREQARHYESSAASFSVNRPNSGRRTRQRAGRIATAAAAVALLFAGVFALGGSAKDEVIVAGEPASSDMAGTPPVTQSTDSGFSNSEVPAPADQETTPAIVLDADDLSNSMWFRNSLEGIVDDDGSVAFPARTTDAPGPIVRESDGDIYVLRQARLFVIPYGSSQLHQVDLGSDALGLARSKDGQVIWWDDTGQSRDIEGLPVDENTVQFQSFEASNGFVVALTDSVLEQNDQGWVTSVLQPARIRITSPSGQTMADFEVSGSSASVAWISDFDGQRLVVGRQGVEPADGPIEAVFIDLKCADGCVEVDLGQGQTVLNSKDVESPPKVEFEMIDLCPQVAADFAPSPPAGMTTDAVESFDHLVRAAQTCDSIAIQPGVQVVPWEAIAAALTGEPTSDGGEFRFSDPEGAASITIDAVGFYVVDLAQR